MKDPNERARRAARQEADDRQMAQERAARRKTPTMEKRRVSALANERAGKYGRTMEARFGLGFDAMFSDGALHDGHRDSASSLEAYRERMGER